MSKNQVVEELHKGARKNFRRRPYEMRGIDDTFQADLIQVCQYAKENKNFNYILVVIDIFSKYAWTEPVKNKTAVCVRNAMKLIFDKSGRICRKMHTDNGKEFFNTHFNNLMKSYNIHHYATYSVMKASIVERLNRTLLSKLWKMYSLRGNHRWINDIQNITDIYNNTKHRTIGMKPCEVTEKNESYLLKNVYKKNAMINVFEATKFRIGDFVRISRYKTIFEKGYTPNWTTEIFKIREVQQTSPITYLLEDLHSNPINGSFYNHELQKSECPDIYLIEKVLRKNKNKLLVKWLGFDSSHNSYIEEKDFV